MTLWIDDPRDDDPIKNDFVHAVARLVHMKPGYDEVVTALALHPGDYYTSDVPQSWIKFVDTEKKRLRDLVHELQKRFPGDETLQPFLTAHAAPRTATDDWYVVPAEPIDSRIVYGEKRHAFFNRRKLRSVLPPMVGDDPWSVLVVEPAAAKGKSHGCTLIHPLVENENKKRAATGDPPVQVYVLDIAKAFPLRQFKIVTARMLASNISLLLGLDRAYGEVLDLTEPTRTAKELARTFSDRFAEMAAADPAPRLLVVDGLDRVNVKDDVLAFVAQLALNAAEGKVPDLRLILTGFKGDFAQKVRDKMQTDAPDLVQPTDVEDFFIEIGNHVGKPLLPQDIVELMDRTYERSPELRDLPVLERALLDIADNWFGP